jgi:tight adherence protein B
VTVRAAGVLSAVLVAAGVLVTAGRGAAARLRLTQLASPDRQVGGRPARRLGEVVALAENLAAAYRAGLAPRAAWTALASKGGPAGWTARSLLPWIDIGVTPGQALSRVTRPRGGSPLVPLVVALDVCDRTGAPAADVLDGLAAALRAEQAAAQEAEVALAAPRATVRVMTALPAMGLGMAALLGADVLHVLVGTTAGRVLLLLGSGLWAAGHWWIRRLVATARAPSGTERGRSPR